ncbi:hypothetical protein Y5A_015465 [Burkholderia glumae AU6208]|nr:hypothetical protein Y5A_015465 [Burkholderia glumae AU6208]
MSRAYDQGACGLVRGPVGKELCFGNTLWDGYGKGNLMTSSNVEMIQAIDPSTREITIIFQR